MSRYDTSVINEEGLNLNPLLRQEETENRLWNTNFKLTFHRIPNITYWCTSINLPSISIGEIKIPTKTKALHVPGSSIEQEHLNISFQLDEEFRNWVEIYKWMRSVVPFDDFSEILHNEANYYSRATVHCLNSAKQPHIRMIFDKLFPVSVSGFDVNSAFTDPDPIVISASFVYESLYIEKVT